MYKRHRSPEKLSKKNKKTYSTEYSLAAIKPNTNPVAKLLALIRKRSNIACEPLSLRLLYREAMKQGTRECHSGEGWKPSFWPQALKSSRSPISDSKTSECVLFRESHKPHIPPIENASCSCVFIRVGFQLRICRPPTKTPQILNIFLEIPCFPVASDDLDDLLGASPKRMGRLSNLGAPRSDPAVVEEHDALEKGALDELHAELDPVTEAAVLRVQLKPADVWDVLAEIAGELDVASDGIRVVVEVDDAPGVVSLVAAAPAAFLPLAASLVNGFVMAKANVSRFSTRPEESGRSSGRTQHPGAAMEVTANHWTSESDHAAFMSSVVPDEHANVVR